MCEELLQYVQKQHKQYNNLAQHFLGSANRLLLEDNVNKEAYDKLMADYGMVSVLGFVYAGILERAGLLEPGEAYAPTEWDKFI